MGKNIHYKRLYLTEEAPICQGRLRLDLGYNAATCVAANILEGRYIYPEAFYQATKELCKECTLIRKIIPKDLVKIKMTKEDYRVHRKRAKEESPHLSLDFTLGTTLQESNWVTFPTSMPSKLPFSSTMD